MINNVDEDYAINFDETSWEVVPMILKYNTNINGNVKKSIVVVAGINADSF